MSLVVASKINGKRLKKYDNQICLKNVYYTFCGLRVRGQVKRQNLKEGFLWLFDSWLPSIQNDLDFDNENDNFSFINPSSAHSGLKSLKKCE